MGLHSWMGVLIRQREQLDGPARRSWLPYALASPSPHVHTWREKFEIYTLKKKGGNASMYRQASFTDRCIGGEDWVDLRNRGCQGHPTLLLFKNLTNISISWHWERNDWSGYRQSRGRNIHMPPDATRRSSSVKPLNMPYLTHGIGEDSVRTSEVVPLLRCGISCLSQSLITPRDRTARGKPSAANIIQGHS